MVEAGGCGSAPAGTGSGVALGPGLVLTAAHVVASGGDLTVAAGDDRSPGRLVAFDPLRDPGPDRAPAPHWPEVPAESR